MNYFKLFEIPLSLKINDASLLKKYYQLSKQYHPDNYTMANEVAQKNAEDMTTLINKTYETLKKPSLRLAYILQQEGIIESDEKYTLSPDFLGDMMELNEQLMELEFEPDTSIKENIKQNLKEKKATLYIEVKEYFEAENLVFDVATSQKLKDYYYKQKYISRIEEKLI